MKFLSFVTRKKPSVDSRFISPVKVVFFIAIVIAILFVLFPKEDLLRNISKQRKADVLTVKYLQNLLVIYPLDVNLKMLLAEQTLSHGEIKKAIKMIEPYIKKYPQTKTDWQALWMYYQIMHIETYAAPKLSYDRIRGIKKLRDLIKVLAMGPLLPKQAIQLGQDAVQIGEPKLAVLIYKRITDFSLDPSISSEEYAKAAKVALGLSQYETCAKLYFLAKKQAKKIDEKRDYYLAGLKAIQSGNLVAKKINFIQENIGSLHSDRQTLLELAKLATAINKPALAESYIKKAMFLKTIKTEQKEQ